MLPFYLYLSQCQFPRPRAHLCVSDLRVIAFGVYTGSLLHARCSGSLITENGIGAFVGPVTTLLKCIIDLQEWFRMLD